MIRIQTILTASLCLSLISGCGHFKKKDEAQEAALAKYERISFANPQATAAERAKCEAADGRVSMGGILGHEECVQTMSDAGKACQDHRDCLSNSCRIEGAAGASIEPGQTISGKCAITDSPFGCYGMVGEGKFQGVLCAD